MRLTVKMRPVAAVLFASAALLWAGDFWESKPPEEWTASEVDQFIQDSPWARSASVEFHGDQSVPLGVPTGRRSRGIGFPGGGVGFPGSGGGRPDGGWGGNHAVEPGRSKAFESDVTIRWRSALPMRQAFARTSGGDAVPQDYVDRYYVIEASALPAAMAHIADEPEHLRQISRLVIKGREPIRAKMVDIRPQPGAPGLYLYFPRDAAITPDDKAVELEITSDEFDVHAKFKLKDMQYRGRLEL